MTVNLRVAIVPPRIVTHIVALTASLACNVLYLLESRTTPVVADLLVHPDVPDI